MSLLLLMSQSDPNPRTLFASNEPGVVFDAQEAYLRGWLWQDTAGQTLAASPGDPIGLQLDTSRGGLDALGSDLVTNGTFDADASWTKGANWTIGSGVATKTGGAANNLTQTISSTAGQWYRCTATVTRTAGTLTISLGTSGTSFAVSASGTYTFFLLAGSSTQTLTFAGDSAFTGTVDAVTARLIPGSHRYQSTSGSRPVLARIPEGGRRNLLTYSEDISNTIWVGYQVTKSSTGFLETVATDEHAISQNISSGDGSIAFTISAEIKGVGGRAWCRVRSRNTGFTATAGGYFELSGAGTLGNSVNTNGSFVSRTITSIADGWYRIVISGITHSVGHTSGIGVSITSAGGNGTASFTGDITQGISIRNVQVETGSSATAYQRVTLNADVTESGKRDCRGILYDGTDDSFLTSSVDFSATDKMTVMSAVRKLSDAARGTVVELTATAASNNGAFHLTAPNAASATYALESKGTTLTDAVASSQTAPLTSVLTGQCNISGDTTTLRVNGTQADSDTGDQGSGNYANAALYFGRRGNASLPYNGYEFCTIIRGAATTDGVIRDFERNLLARRAGISF